MLAPAGSRVRQLPSMPLPNTCPRNDHQARDEQCINSIMKTCQRACCGTQRAAELGSAYAASRCSTKSAQMGTASQAAVAARLGAGRSAHRGACARTVHSCRRGLTSGSSIKPKSGRVCPRRLASVCALQRSIGRQLGTHDGWPPQPAYHGSMLLCHQQAHMSGSGGAAASLSESDTASASGTGS